MKIIFTERENYKKFSSSLCQNEYSFEDFHLEQWTEGKHWVQNGKIVAKIIQLIMVLAKHVWIKLTELVLSVFSFMLLGIKTIDQHTNFKANL